MANFTEAVEQLKKIEGETLVSSPLETSKYGISFAGNKDFLAANFGIASPALLSKLTWEQAKQVYYANYWKAIWEQLPQDWANLIFNFYINAPASIYALQLAIYVLGGKDGEGADIAVDGAYGSKTQAALLDLKAKGMDGNLKGMFLFYLSQRYKNLAQASPAKYASSLSGWLARIDNTGYLLYEPAKTNERQREQTAFANYPKITTAASIPRSTEILGDSGTSAAEESADNFKVPVTAIVLFGMGAAGLAAFVLWQRKKIEKNKRLNGKKHLQKLY